MRKGWLLIVFLLVIPLTYSYDQQNKVKASLKIEEVSIQALLNEDSSVSYTETVGITYNKNNFSENPNGVLKIPIPQEASINPLNIQVIEEITGTEYKKVYTFDDECNKQFIFDDNKFLIICIPNNGQLRLTVVFTILPDSSFSQFSQTGLINDNIKNDFKIIFPGTDYNYKTIIFLGGSEGIFTIPADNFCKDPITSKISNMTVLPAGGGVICYGDILPVDKDVMEITVGLAGENKAKAETRGKKEIEELQKENIKASITASGATKWNAFFTLVLVLVTIFYAHTSYKTLKEMRKSNRPLVSARLDPLGINLVALKIVNVGNSTARNIFVDYKVLPNGPKGTWRYHLLQKDDFARLVIYHQSLQSFVDKFEKISLITNCKDIHGVKHPDDNFEINLKDMKQSMANGNWIWDTSFKEDVENISKKIKEISEILKNKEIKVDIKNVELNPQKIKSDIKIYENLLQKRKQRIDKLNEENKN